ncbi:excinuclease ABC subunit UvrA [Patescibacteria group bacterium]|nr:excinuclease ABC subunit UvrA [Patescibacteria group bacterium]MBU4580523.1 excinuclease ABC subunit UvrA [Patescibacteria group bacterium]
MKQKLSVNSRQVIKIRGARTHNLKNISLDIPRNQLVVLTGLSGSGKSSLAFDTIYAEAQRRYLENLSGDFGKIASSKNSAEVDEIQGLSPAIAIDQKNCIRTSRSTVGTMTEIYDYLRLLFTRAGAQHCPGCGKALIKYTPLEIYNEIIKIKKDGRAKIFIFSPLGSSPSLKLLNEAKSEGFFKIKTSEGIIPVNEFLPKIKNNKEKVFLLIEEIIESSLFESFNEKNRLRDVIVSALKYGKDSLVASAGGREKRYGAKFYCEECDFTMENLSPRMFSFNHPSGACPACTGLGMVLKVSADLIIPNFKLTLAEGAIKPWRSSWNSWQNDFQALNEASKRLNFSVDVPLVRLTKEALDMVLYGQKLKSDGASLLARNPQEEAWRGVVPLIEAKYRQTASEFIKAEIEQYMVKRICPDCQGKRLNKTALAVRIGDKSIDDFVQMPIEKLYGYFKNEFSGSSIGADKKAKSAKKSKGGELKANDQIIAPILKEIILRTQIITEINLGYLMLARASDTLSAGESERLRLSAQIGASLSGILYVFDEPSIGLHPRDNEKIIKMLLRLRDLGNSVLVVEHDEAFIRAADWIVDIGLGAGKTGGNIMASGTLKDVAKSKGYTGQYLSGKLLITRARKQVGKIDKKNSLCIFGAAEFNLKNIDIVIPLGKLVCFTGVSGSGKSTLIDDILGKYLSKRFYNAKDEAGRHKKIIGVENLKKVIRINQNPIGRTPRSNAATYTGLFNRIREIFTDLPEAKRLGYKIGHFSFNVKGGRCESCKGDGVKKVEMYFLSDVYVPCEDCNGARYTEDTLRIKYKGKNIAEVLEMSAEEALSFFAEDSALASQLSLLEKVGLGYLRLGQPATHLSGGEAQRIKLASELSRPEKQGTTLYIMDEPTVGLHPEDVRNLLNVLSQLVDRGNTVLLIEHNMDIIKNADWIIDLGPEGGDKGGEIVAQGTPEQVAKVKRSYTGRFLKKALKNH